MNFLAMIDTASQIHAADITTFGKLRQVIGDGMGIIFEGQLILAEDLIQVIDDIEEIHGTELDAMRVDFSDGDDFTGGAGLEFDTDGERFAIMDDSSYVLDNPETRITVVGEIA